MRKVYTSKLQSPSLNCTNAKGGEAKWPRSQRSQVPTKPCHNLASSSLVPLTSSAGAPCGGERFIAIPLFRQTCYDVQYMINNFMSFPYLFFVSNIPFKIVSQLANLFFQRNMAQLGLYSSPFHQGKECRKELNRSQKSSWEAGTVVLHGFYWVLRRIMWFDLQQLKVMIWIRYTS
jgi:hypothetical protein